LFHEPKLTLAHSPLTKRATKLSISLDVHLLALLHEGWLVVRRPFFLSTTTYAFSTRRHEFVKHTTREVRQDQAGRQNRQAFAAPGRDVDSFTNRDAEVASNVRINPAIDDQNPYRQHISSNSSYMSMQSSMSFEEKPKATAEAKSSCTTSSKRPKA
jgi:hypothetical protein